MRVLVDTVQGDQVRRDDCPCFEHITVPLEDINKVFWKCQMVVADDHVLDVREPRLQMVETNVQPWEVPDVFLIQDELYPGELPTHRLQGRDVVLRRIIVHDHDANVSPVPICDQGRDGRSSERRVVVVRTDVTDLRHARAKYGPVLRAK